MQRHQRILSIGEVENIFVHKILSFNLRLHFGPFCDIFNFLYEVTQLSIIKEPESGGIRYTFKKQERFNFPPISKMYMHYKTTKLDSGVIQ